MNGNGEKMFVRLKGGHAHSSNPNIVNLANIVSVRRYATDNGIAVLTMVNGDEYTDHRPVEWWEKYLGVEDDE